MEEPERKKAKTASDASSTLAGGMDSTIEGPAAISLLRVRQLRGKGPEDEGCFGLRLRQAMGGENGFPSRVVLSNMMCDVKWLLTACPGLQRAKELAFLLPSGEAERVIVEAREFLGTEGPKLEAHSPRVLNRFGSHHAKMGITFFEHGVRVAISTANFIYQDCNCKSQACWVQDFPTKRTASKSDFELTLVEYLKNLGAQKGSIIDRTAVELTDYDFSMAGAYLIGSMPGRHSGSRWGLPAVRNCLGREEISESFSNSSICCQASSMGSLDEAYLSQELCGALSASKGDSVPSPKSLSISWPSVEQVRRSYEGWAAGVSIPPPSKNVDAVPVKSRLRKWDGSASDRERAMPHIKSYVRYSQENPRHLAWCLVSSANLSKAALGRRVKKDGTLEILHYEMGVLITPSSMKAYLSSAFSGFDAVSGECAPSASCQEGLADDGTSVCLVAVSPGQGAFDAMPSACAGSILVPVPLPHRLPPPPYEEGDIPWATDRKIVGPDCLGKTAVSVSFYGHNEPPPTPPGASEKLGYRKEKH